MTLTQKDIEQIEEIVAETVREEIKHLPTKDEFFNKMDEVMGELQKIREETTVVNGRTSGH